MIQMVELIDSLKDIEHGFKHIVEVGNTILSNNKTEYNFELARKLLKDDSYQLRMLSTYILGQVSPMKTEALSFLEDVVANDSNWRVQEMLAKSFDHYCKSIGYENSIDTIERWLSDRNSNIVRATIEGLRIWTSRKFFKDNPEIAISLISNHKNNDSLYVRKSVGNALRDINKGYAGLISKEVSTWNLSDKKTYFTYKLINRK
jgi:3-methyladenine DNA glycosylase AlkD